MNISCKSVFQYLYLRYRRVRLGDTVSLKQVEDIKFASSVQILPFQDTITNFKGAVHEGLRFSLNDPFYTV